MEEAFVELTLIEAISWSQDPTHVCAEQPVIPAINFESMAEMALGYPEVTKTSEEMISIFQEQTKRFAACGANHSDRFGVLRRNPTSGWQYIVDLITEK